jgi:ACR3 family arsenite transporter
MKKQKQVKSVFSRKTSRYGSYCAWLPGFHWQISSAIPGFLSRFEYARVSIPIAVLIWLMIYPMMMKVDFASIKNSDETRAVSTLPGLSTG